MKKRVKIKVKRRGKKMIDKEKKSGSIIAEE